MNSISKSSFKYRNRLLMSATAIVPVLALITALSFCSSAKPVIQIDPYWNDLSRFLAGMPIGAESKFFQLTQTDSYKKHVKFMDDFWKGVQHGTLTHIIPWRNQSIPARHQKNTVFYPLSGADFINMYSIFPDSPQYLMVAMEKPGSVPEPLKLPKWGLDSGLASLRRGVYLYGYYNYFQSAVMSQEMINHNITGITPYLLVFMTRLDIKIINVENVGIDNAGRLVKLHDPVTNPNPLLPGEKIDVKGVQISFLSPGKTEIQKVLYLSMKLTNDSVSPASSSGKFFAGFGEMRTMMKSAVYLLHYSHFNKVKEFVVDKSIMLVQDDSGVPYDNLQKNQWEIKLYGIYQPIPVQGCMIKTQINLKKDYKAQWEKETPLAFKYGYGGTILQRNLSNLMVAMRKTGESITSRN